MTRKLIKLSVFIISLIIFPHCSSDEEINGNDPVIKKERIELSAHISHLTDVTTNDSLAFGKSAWLVNDQLGAFVYDGSQRSKEDYYELRTDESLLKSQSFFCNIEVSSADNNKYQVDVVYPYLAYSINSETNKYEMTYILGNQTQDCNNPDAHLSSTDLLTGNVQLVNWAPTSSVPMYHRMAVLRLDIKNEEERPLQIMTVGVETPANIYIAGQCSENTIFDYSKPLMPDESVNATNHLDLTFKNSPLLKPGETCSAYLMTYPFMLNKTEQFSIFVASNLGHDSINVDMADKYEFVSGKQHVIVLSVKDSKKDGNIIIPDQNFKEWLVAQSFNTNKDKEISYEEAKKIKSIDVRNKNIESLQGIEHMFYLETLNCSDNKINDLNLSENIKLKELLCDNNKLGSINFGSEKNLLEKLSCNNNALYSLDLNNSKGLKELSCSTNSIESLNLSGTSGLIELNCDNNKIIKLELSSDTLLKTISCASNKLDSLNLTNNINLQKLLCPSNQLVSLNTTSNPLLKELYCQDNKLKELNISNNKQLEKLDATSNENLKTVWVWDGFTANPDFNIPETVEIKEKSKNIYIPDPNFKKYLLSEYDKDGDGEISIAEALKITDILAYDRCISSLVGIEKMINLVRLCVQFNSIAELDLSKNTKLEILNCSYNSGYIYGDKLTSLNLSKNRYLKEVDCGENDIKILDIIHNEALEKLNCHGNKLTSLNLSNSQQLLELDCSDNGLYPELDISKCLKLVKLETLKNYHLEKILVWEGFEKPASYLIDDFTKIEVKGNGSKNIDIPDPNFKKYLLSEYDKDGDGEISIAEAVSIYIIKYGYDYGEVITSLKGISMMPNLQNLDIDPHCFYSGTTIDLSHNPKLEQLSLPRTKISNIDISKNTQLVKLNLYYANISSIDLSQNTELKELDLSSTKISSIDIRKNTRLVKLNLYNTLLNKLDISKNMELSYVNAIECEFLTDVFVWVGFLNLDSNLDILKLPPHTKVSEVMKIHTMPNYPVKR